MISALIGSAICARTMRSSLRVTSPVIRFSSRPRLNTCRSLPVEAASNRLPPFRLTPT
ncbi:hypothetical protein D3C71_1827390 [compost metagenome]